MRSSQINFFILPEELKFIELFLKDCEVIYIKENTPQLSDFAGNNIPSVNDKNPTLLAEQTDKIEETMWTALRMFEERRNLLTTIAKDGKIANSRSAAERARLSQVHIDRIRAILLADDKGTKNDQPN
jgi:hypothetical protein